MKRTVIILLTVLLTLGLTMAGPALAGPDDDHNTVTDLTIISAVQTSATQMVVTVQARFCEECKPNTSDDEDGYGVGCDAFTHGGPPPPPYYYDCVGVLPPYEPEPDWVTGRYVAVRVTDSGDNVLGTEKMECDPTTWPLGSIHQADIVVNTTPMGCWVRVEADIFCGWCGHYFRQLGVYDQVPPEVSVVEAVNPSGKKVPPAGSTTLPGSKGGINEDGFYKLIAEDNCPRNLYMIICYWDPETSWYVAVTDKAGDVFSCLSGTVVKLTQAPGATPSVKKMGSSKGKAGAVDYHITVPGHRATLPAGYPETIVVAYDYYGNSSWALADVPPPPK